jgi:2-polyprenyl-3-methyl-5-hydroxy-6-metoxy-1,4-benzoquinol methylase
MSYEDDTRGYYKSDRKAKEYHAWFTNAKGINGWRFRYIADKERSAVARLMVSVPHMRVIDVPTGTGKMAPVFKRFGSKVLACDVSENMLSIARQTYRDDGVPAEFQVVDLENATETIDRSFDLTVCVRLMHRVPDEIKFRMLAQIAMLSPFAIVSFAKDSAYERLRGRARRATMRKGSDSKEMHANVRTTWPTMAELDRIVCGQFEVVERVDVSPLLSAEVMYLLKSKSFAG